MKQLKYYAIILCLAFIVMQTGCKDDPASPMSDLEQQLDLLMNGGKSWVVGSSGVVKDGFDVTDQFAGFKLTVGNKSYSTTNGLSHVWNSTGAWDFKDGNKNQILIDGSTEASVSVSAGKLTLTFTAQGSSGGRTKSIEGEYQFNLVSE